MTPQQLADEVLRLDEKATQEPWYIEGSEIRYDCAPSTTESGISDCTVQICDLPRISAKLDDRRNDRILIEHYRTSAPKLARMVKIMSEVLSDIQEYRSDAENALAECQKIAEEK